MSAEIWSKLTLQAALFRATNKVIWQPTDGEMLWFQKETDDEHDQYAVALKTESRMSPPGSVLLLS